MNKKSMVGAIVGDVVGSRWELGGCKTKDFRFLQVGCEPTDDSVLTLAIGDALLSFKRGGNDLSELASLKLKEWWCYYPFVSYGAMFEEWVSTGGKVPYNSWGNGSAMRVSFCGWAAQSLQEAHDLSDAVTCVTHNHPEGMRGAAVIAESVYLARNGVSKRDLREHVERNYRPIDFTLDQIRDKYDFDVSCQGSVPQALEAFFESNDFEDAIRNAISIGGDSDTIGAICGAVAGAFYGVPDGIVDATRFFLDERMCAMLDRCENEWCVRQALVD